MNDIVAKAKELGICQKWGEEMQSSPKMALYCKMYFDGEDWAMEQDFPTLELLQKYKGQTEEYGLYTDHQGAFENWDKIAFFGKSVVEIDYNCFQVGKVNIRHDSKAKIIAEDNAIVMINILDNAEVEVEAKDNAKIFVYRYGLNTKVQSKGSVLVKDRTF